jgi:DNA helicase-2/ATP-dependent DNA helicase PcrA
VFLVGTNKEVWEGKSNSGSPFSISKVMAPAATMPADENDATENKITNANEEELRRLFYVALTRAETNITVSYHRFSNKAQNVEQSLFVTELCESAGIEPTMQHISTEDKEAFVMLELTSIIKPKIAEIEKEVIERNLNKFTMNVSALNNFLKCPLRFYFNNLLKMPATKNANMSFGTAIHAALEKLFKKMRDSGDQQFPTSDELVHFFKTSMALSREGFSEADYIRWLEYGEKILSQYYGNYVHTWNKIVTLEYTAHSVVDGVPIKGKIDKLEFYGTDAVAIDYKTGDYSKPHTKASLLPPNDKEPIGGNYWRQAVFYKILIDGDSRKNWTVKQSAFDFVEPNDGKFTIKQVPIGPEDITTVKQQIKAVWEKIQQHDFYTGCGSKDCDACNLVKENKFAVDYIIEESDEDNEILIPQD